VTAVCTRSLIFVAFKLATSAAVSPVSAGELGAEAVGAETVTAVGAAVGTDTLLGVGSTKAVATGSVCFVACFAAPDDVGFVGMVTAWERGVSTVSRPSVSDTVALLTGSVTPRKSVVASLAFPALLEFDWLSFCPKVEYPESAKTSKRVENLFIEFLLVFRE